MKCIEIWVKQQLSTPGVNKKEYRYGYTSVLICDWHLSPYLHNTTNRSNLHLGVGGLDKDLQYISKINHH